MQAIYTLGTSSASHTYGNVASHIRVYLERQFPRNFITHTYIDSKIAWKELNEVLGNGDREFHKRHYPYMIINPRFTDQDTNRYLFNTPLTKNMDDTEMGLRRNTLFPIIRDARSRMGIYYKLNRDTINFDVEVRLKSQPQQLDIYKNLENQLKWDQPFTKPASLEACIPRSMIAYLGRAANIDIDQSTEQENLVPLMMQYLNRHAVCPITYKVRNSTSVEEFFVYYQTNLLITLSDLNPGDGVKKNAIDEYYPITFRVSVDFNLPGLYALMGENEARFKAMKLDAIVGNSTGGAQLIPMYTACNLYDNYTAERPDGFQFYSSNTVMVNKEDMGKDEVIKIDDILADTHLRVLQRLLMDNVPPDTIFRFRVLLDDHEIPCNRKEELCPKSWDVDWNRRTITIHHGDPTVTYRILVYANMIMLNERLADMHDTTKYDKSKL